MGVCSGENCWIQVFASMVIVLTLGENVLFNNLVSPMFFFCFCLFFLSGVCEWWLKRFFLPRFFCKMEIEWIRERFYGIPTGKKLIVSLLYSLFISCIVTNLWPWGSVSLGVYIQLEYEQGMIICIVFSLKKGIKGRNLWCRNGKIF